MKKSSKRDSFSDTTKRALADRAGHHCSLCLALTTSSDGEGKPFPIGDAAHQAAASDRGPRYDSSQTKAERSSAKNGIWLCGSCHRKIDGDKYRYTVKDLKEMKDEAEERARRMVHGEIVFEMKDKEHAAIEHYLGSRPLRNRLPTSSSVATPAVKVASGAMLGVQIVPYIAITDRPRLDHAELIDAGAPTSRHGYPRPDPDAKGVFVEVEQKVSRIDRDATAELWIDYPEWFGHSGTMALADRRLPSEKIAKDILRYLRNVREVFAKHNIRSPRVIVRMRFENVLGKMLVHDVSGTASMPLREPILETSYAIVDQEEDKKILEELWYCAGAHGLPQNILDVIQKFSEGLSQ